MGLITKTIFTTLLGTSGTAAYLAARNPVISPLAVTDPIWTSSLYKRYNPSRNPATQDVCIKRIPLNKIRPELLQKEGDLALEFCRGVWSGWGKYQLLRKYFSIANWWQGLRFNGDIWTSSMVVQRQQISSGPRSNWLRAPMRRAQRLRITSRS